MPTAISSWSPFPTGGSSVDPNASVELYCDYDGEPNGLKIHRDGRIFIADHHRGLMVLDPGTRKVTPVLERVI